MAATPSRTFNLFGYRHDDEDGERDIHRIGIPHWRLSEAVKWAFSRGVDSLLIDAGDNPESSSRDVTHHLCTDPHCPGGCT